MTPPVALRSIEQDPAIGRNEFQAGAGPITIDHYVREYVPSDTNLLHASRIEPVHGVEKIEASAAIAAESSTGTQPGGRSHRATDTDGTSPKSNESRVTSPTSPIR